MIETKLTAQNGLVSIGILSGYANGRHTHEYRVFDLANPIPHVGLIGVNTQETFAVQFRFDQAGDYAIALYLDGINATQRNGITSLNEIPENQREHYKAHKNLFISRISAKGRTATINRYDQISGENRLFTFTTADNSGINEILINDPSLSNRIEVYVWREEEVYDEMIGNIPATKIGAGDATHESYKTTTGLSCPKFLGKVMFIHTHAANVSHLGKALLTLEELNDPMNRVAKS